MSKAILVAGLGYGDEGKGTTVEYLVAKEKATVVVRYNGGAQAAHNVVSNDGRHHTFSQFGSGTLLGAETYLSRFMLVDPLSMIPEAEHLKEIGVSDPLALVSIEGECPIITPYHRATNRIREKLRGAGRHGSCGVGVGECRADHLQHGSEMLLARDLNSTTKTLEKLEHIRGIARSKLGEALVQIADDDRDKRLILSSPKTWLARYADFARQVFHVGRDNLTGILAQSGAVVVFEGAQGVLLDETYGFHPHTTWTDITFGNAEQLLRDSRPLIERWGVVRTHATRHGAGPFVTEDTTLDPAGFDEFNTLGRWQGGFRVGTFDRVALRYALSAIGGVDRIALTHCDRPIDRVCVEYQPADEDTEFFEGYGIRFRRRPTLEYQEKLGQALTRTRPMSIHDSPIKTRFFGTPVGMQSFGPRLQDKKTL